MSLNLQQLRKWSITYLQNTNFTTRGMFFVGFFVSPAVTPKLSVPPSEGGEKKASVGLIATHLHAKLAVTKTLAKPPNPPTKGAPSICQYFEPIYSCDWFIPKFTNTPNTINVTTVAILREESQYSDATSGQSDCKTNKCYIPSSPYAETWVAFTPTRNTQKTRLTTQGFHVVQNCSTSWAAVRSEATETASLNQ